MPPRLAQDLERKNAPARLCTVLYTTVRMSSVSVTEARATLPDIIERVLAGEEVTLTRHGDPVAVLVRPDSLRARRGEDMARRAAELHALLESARGSLPPEGAGLSAERVEELVAHVQWSRGARWED